MIVADTIRDTIPRIVTVKETVVQEVNRLRWWQKVLCWVGGIALLVCGVAIAWRWHSRP